MYQNCSDKYRPENRVEEEIDVVAGSEPFQEGQTDAAVEDAIPGLDVRDEETEQIEISEAMEMGIEREDTKCNAGEEGISTQCHNGTVACISGSGEDYRNKRCGPLDRLTEGLIMNDCVERVKNKRLPHLDQQFLKGLTYLMTIIS